MPSVSEFERNKPRETHKAFENARKKYEGMLQETTVMDDADAARVEMASIFLKDLKEIYKKFLSGL